MDRLILFLVPLVILLIGECLRPRRRLTLPRHRRWPGAIFLLLIGTVLSRLILPAGLVGIALWGQRLNFGLFLYLDFPIWFEVIIGFILFDLAVWTQHVAMHKLDVLWRFHRVHHADPDFDVITALRFHPGELLVSLAWKSTVILALGVPAWAVLSYAAVLNISAMFNHSNIALPLSIDRIMRYVIVTPDMHRVHHSTDHAEANRNFGFCLAIWDRVFDVYADQPQMGHENMHIGQAQWRTGSDQSLWALLLQPRYRP